MDLAGIFTAASPALIQLIEHCLTLNPKQRCSATDALHSAYFSETPFPCDDTELPIVGGGDFGPAAKKRRLNTSNGGGIGPGGESSARRLEFMEARA